MLRGIAGSIVLAAVCAVALWGCGGDDSPKLDDEQQVRATLARFETASAQRDYAAVCKDVLAEALIAKMRSVNVPCEAAVRTGLSEVSKPTITVASVQVRGASATAVVRSTAKGQKPSTDLLRLVKERRGWRLASLAEPRRARQSTPKQPAAKRPGGKRPSSKRRSAKRPNGKARERR